ncbi:MAG: TraB/GumN family protein [Tannerella sp.]|uniref:TraB/GumN family protein n=1 Tax=Tannerella sp. TaxID=2382127 RepID=UPI003FA1C44A
MKRILIALFLLSSFSTGICSAQSTQEAELKNNENSLLWRISGNGLQHDSYLLGTMHNVHRTFLDSISGFRKAFKAAKQVAVECDLFTAESDRNSKSKEELKDYIFMPQDTTYAMLYSSDDYQFVDSIMRSGNRQYFKYKPFFWHNFFTKMIIYDSIKNIQSSMDGFILLIGYQNNKKICFMETLEDIGRKATEFDSLGYVMDLHDQAKMLQYILKYPNSTRPFVNQMKKYYFKQALTQLSIDSLTKQLKIEDAPQIVRDRFKLLLSGKTFRTVKN